MMTNIETILFQQSFAEANVEFPLHKKCFLRIWSHLLKKSLTENFIFCAVFKTYYLRNIRDEAGGG